MFNDLGKILKGKFTRKEDFSKQVEIAQVLDRVREEIKTLLPNAEGIEVISLQNKVLSISAPNSVLASEIRLRAPDIIAKINEKFSKEVVNRVIYRF